MSLNKKLNDIAEYVYHKLPELDFVNLSVRDKSVNDICNSIFHKNDKELKKNIVKALKRDNSSLRKIISTMSDNTLTSNVCDDSLIKCLESCNYTCKDFQQYNTEVLNDVCKRLKITVNRKNNLMVFRKCNKVFNQSCVDINKQNINLCMTIEKTLEDKSYHSVVDDSPIIMPVESSYVESLSYVKDTSDEIREVSTINAVCSRDKTEGMLDLSVVTFKNIVTSTPEGKNGDLSERQIRMSNKKYKKVESPLKRLMQQRTPVKSGVVLPRGTKNRHSDPAYNCRQDKDYNFRSCKVLEGKFWFTKDEWSYIVTENEKGCIVLNPNKYPTMFRKRIKTVNNTCVVSFKSVNYPRSMNHYIVYMYCNHPGCKLFKLKVLPEEYQTIVWVFSSSKDFYHNPNNSLTNHVRGIQRDLVRETLKETKAFKYTNEAVKSASPSKLRCGNLQNIKSDDVIRKIRSEAISEDDYAREDYEDLLGMCHNENYVQLVAGFPSYVHCYSDEQLELLTTMKSKGKGTVTGYLDATGTVVRKINSNNKRILYYAIVISASLPVKSGVTCPIVEMVSSSHDIVAITQWLVAFKAFVLKKKQEWPVFTNIVTDFSYAQMHSLCIGWNGFSSIFDYLNWCYLVLFEPKDTMNTVTIINVCANHYTKIIVNHVRTHFLKTSDVRGLKRMQNSIIDWICLLFNMDSMEEIEVWFKLFTIVLSSNTKTDYVNSALSALQNKCVTLGDVEHDENYDESCSDVVNKVLCETQTSKSLMYCRFQNIRNSVKKAHGCDLNFGREVNEYFDEDYLQQFILKCVPFIPLWTPVMNKKLYTGVEVRQSNATVESWFKTVKIDMLDGDRRLKCGRFLRKIHDHVSTVCKRVKYSIKKKRCTRVLHFDDVLIKPKKMHTVSDVSAQNKLNFANETYLDSVEEWGKKEKQLKHLQPVGFRPFKVLKLKNHGQVINCSQQVLPEGNKTLNKQEQNTLEKVSERSYKGLEYQVSGNNISRISLDCRLKSLTTLGSQISPFRRENCEIELYENMLPTDLAYYRLMRMPKGKNGEYYTVGKYSCISNSKSNGVLPELDIRDFDTLSGDKWLNNFVIDVCLKLNVLKLNLLNVEVMSCNTVHELLTPRDIGENCLPKINIKENSTIFMPWNVNSSHWIIAIVDFKNKNCFIMDPMNPATVDDRKNRTPQNRFKLLCKSLKSKCEYGDSIDFPMLSFIPCPMENIPKQIDGYNCGVFIIYYAFTIMARLDFDLGFDPNEYRKYLKKYLLKNSDDMNDICLFCSRSTFQHRCQDDESCVQWVSCDRCCRWISVDCMPERYRFIDNENCNFLCPLCAPQEWTDV